MCVVISKFFRVETFQNFHSFSVLRGIERFFASPFLLDELLFTLMTCTLTRVWWLYAKLSDEYSASFSKQTLPVFRMNNKFHEEHDDNSL